MLVLPTLVGTQSQTPPLVVLNEPASGVGAPLVSFGSSEAYSTVEPVVIPTYSGDELAIAVPSRPVRVETPNRIYTPALDADNPQPGEFTYSDGDLTLYLDDEAPPEGTSILIEYQDAGNTIPTNELLEPVPELYKTWNVEEASYSRSFEGQPTASIKFTAASSQRNAIIAAFRNRTPYTLRSIPFEVDSLTISEESSDLYPDGVLTVDVSFIGAWDYPSSQPVYWLGTGGTNSNYTSNRKVPIPVSAIAQRAGVPYAGTDYTEMIPLDSKDATTTLSSAIGEKVRLGGEFVVWSGGSVTTRKFGLTSHRHLSDIDLIGSLSFSYPGKEQIYQGIQLVETYKNSELQLEFEQEDQPIPPNRVLYDPPNGPIYPPVVDLVETSKAFDNGGPTSLYRVIYMTGNTTTREVQQKWGFAFSSADVYILATYSTPEGNVTKYRYADGTNPQDYWQVCEEVETTYEYDYNGYLRSVSKRGWRLQRFRKESSFEAMEMRLTQDALDPGDTTSYNALEDSISLYSTFYRLPINNTTSYDLVPLSQYYRDVPPSQVPELFCQTERNTEASVQETGAPEAAGTTTTAEAQIKGFAGGNRVTLRMGKLATTETRITIPKPQRKGYEIYYTYQFTSNQEGTDLEDGLRIGEVQLNNGRPGSHTRSQDVYAPIQFTLGAIDSQNYKFLLNTDGNGYAATAPEQQSYSAKTDNLDTALIAARTDSAITNSREAESATIEVGRWYPWQEGDMLWVRGKLYVIFSLSWSEKPQSGRVFCDGMQLQIGRYLNPEIDLSTLPINASNSVLSV